MWHPARRLADRGHGLPWFPGFAQGADDQPEWIDSKCVTGTVSKSQVDVASPVQDLSPTEPEPGPDHRCGTGAVTGQGFCF